MFDAANTVRWLLETDMDDPEAFLRNMPGTFYVAYRLDAGVYTEVAKVEALSPQDAIRRFNAHAMQQGLAVERIYGAYTEADWKD